MSVRKRLWTTSKGEGKEAWIVDYVDQQGDRHIETFQRKKDADAYHATVRVNVRSGVHIADSKSVTVAEAGEQWIRSCESEDLERATIDEYRRHLRRHIVPYLGNVRLSKLNVATVTAFRKDLGAGAPAPGQNEGAKRSAAMVKKIMSSLSSLLSEAQESGLVAQNVTRSLTNRRKRKKATQRRKLDVGVDIPAPSEIKAIIGKLSGRWRPLLLTAIFTGLRASELRGLRWIDVDLKGVIHVRQRADRYNKIDKPKSDAGQRTVPLTPIVLSALREWKLACPKGDLGLVFPNGAGHVENHGNILNRGFLPAQIAAGVSHAVKDEAGKDVFDGDKPIVEAKYTGLHALRHFYASWCINRKADGGLELPAKVVQNRLGHSSIVMTMDVYGHLFKATDDTAEMAAAEHALLG